MLVAGNALLLFQSIIFFNKIRHVLNQKKIFSKPHHQKNYIDSVREKFWLVIASAELDVEGDRNESTHSDIIGITELSSFTCVSYK